MKTEIIKIDPDRPEFEKLARCARVIRQGGLVIFPTETVYGIAANFHNERAIARLREVKRRPENKPFAVLIAQKELISNFTPVREPAVYKLIDACWPGPLTIVVPAHEPGATIGIRMPQNKIALQLVQESRCTVAAPSANFSGSPAPSTCEEALKELDGMVELAIDGGTAKFGQASSVVDFTKGGKPAVVRQGAISQEEVDRITQTKVILFVCTGNSCRSVMAEYLLRQMLKDRHDVEVYSAGANVYLQATASAETVAVLKQRGIDASQHRARPINNILLHKSDLILVMTRTHRKQVLEWAPEVETRVYQLKEFAQEYEHGVDLDIPDPMGSSVDKYEECLAVIESALKKIVNLI